MVREFGWQTHVTLIVAIDLPDGEFRVVVDVRGDIVNFILPEIDCSS